MSLDPRPCALVTGAAHRIGRAIAEALAVDGYRVGVHYGTSGEDAEALAALLDTRHGRGTATTMRADLSQEAETTRLLARAESALGAVTCLVNNASIFEPDGALTMSRASWDRHIETNLRAPLVLAQAFARALPPQQTGVIINILDQRVLRPGPDYFSYTLSKTALYAATRMLALALAPRVRVNGIGPGPVLASIHQTAEEFSREAAGTPLGRATPPEEIADAVRYILRAPAMTGQMIALDGGQHLLPRTNDTGTV